MIRLHLVTWLEVLGVLIGLISLGSIGILVTPKGTPSLPLSTLWGNQPERVIDDARLGYQVDTCVRDISPRTVLSEGATGAPEFVVLEGAPVTECFPELAGFIQRERAGESNVGGTLGKPSSLRDGAPGADVQTSVTVISPSPSSTSIVLQAPNNIVPTPGSPRVNVPASSTWEVSVPPSGGATGGSGSGGTALPPADRFDTCRTRLFGTTIPTALTKEEQGLFEQCLFEELPP